MRKPAAAPHRAAHTVGLAVPRGSSGRYRGVVRTRIGAFKKVAVRSSTAAAEEEVRRSAKGVRKKVRHGSAGDVLCVLLRCAALCATTQSLVRLLLLSLSVSGSR